MMRKVYPLTAVAVLGLAAWFVSRAGSVQPANPDQPGSRPAARPKMPPLTAAEKRIILHKGTERPFTGRYWDHFERGAYVCRQCGAALYRSDGKFKSHCGWPSFDEEIAGAVKRQRDADGRRTEIVCAACGGHLGHVFLGESFTPKNTRHCVNSTSIVFVPAAKAATQPATQPATRRAIFAAGCFWGVEYQFEQVPGVWSVTSGYTGGDLARPTYKQVCAGGTGHAEAVEVVFDPAKVTYERLARLFFETHDPTQLARQGAQGRGQYRSAVFYVDDEQKAVVEKLIRLLRDRGYKVVTQVVAAGKFWPAEDYHQDYLKKNPRGGTCARPVPRFGSPSGDLAE